MTELQKQIDKENVPREYRNECVEYYMKLMRCRRSTWFNPWKCDHEEHEFNNCRYMLQNK